MQRRRNLLARRLPLPWTIAWRYVRGERSQMLASTTWAALLATALGVTAMVVAMALMTGYTEDLQHKLIGLQGEVIASPLGPGSEGFAEHGERLAAAAALPGIARMGRAAYGEGSLSSQAEPEGLSVVLRGVDPRVDPIVDDPAHLATAEGGVPGVLLGSELAKRLAAAPGDVLRLVVLQLGDRAPRFHYRSVRTSGTFTSGFAQFDSSWVLLDREVLEGLRGDTGFDVVEFKLVDPRDTDRIAAQLEEVLGPDFVVNSWLRLNRELFAALKLQEMLLFLVLGLIVLVSTFNVASTLVILVRERMRDVGVLGSLGLEPRQLWWIFTTYGLLLGAAGTLAGVALGGGAAWILTTFELVRFDAEIAAIYFIDSVPFRVEASDLLAIVGFTLAVTLVACALPAYRAARILPSVALRHE